MKVVQKDELSAILSRSNKQANTCLKSQKDDADSLEVISGQPELADLVIKQQA